jgi:hypothetical protein
VKMASAVGDRGDGGVDVVVVDAQDGVEVVGVIAIDELLVTSTRPCDGPLFAAVDGPPLFE